MSDTMIFALNAFSGLVQMILQQAIVLTIARERWTVKRLLLIMSIIFTIHTIANYFFDPMSFGVQAFWVFLLFASYAFFYRIPFWKSAVMAVAQMLANSGLEYLIVFILSFFPTTVQVYIATNLFTSRCFIVVLYAAMYLFLQKLMSKKSVSIVNPASSYVLFYLVFMYVFVDAILLNIEFKSEPFVNHTSELVVVSLFIFLFAVNLAYIQKIKKTTAITQELEHKELYLGSLEKSLNNLRGFKHDFMNIINTIYGYLDLQDYESMKRYLDELNVDVLNVKTTDIINNEIKKIPILYGVLLTNLSLAEVQGISFDIAIECELNTRYCSIVDFSRMIGIFLNNALEAAAKSSERLIRFRLFSQHDRTCIEIVNSCDGPVDTKKIFLDGFTTKVDHSGFGLTQVMMIINKYKNKGRNIELYTHYRNQSFLQLLKI